MIDEKTMTINNNETKQNNKRKLKKMRKNWMINRAAKKMEKYNKAPVQRAREKQTNKQNSQNLNKSTGIIIFFFFLGLQQREREHLI